MSRRRTRPIFFANECEPRLWRVQAFSRSENLVLRRIDSAGGNMKLGPRESLSFRGTNWRNNVNLIRNFGYRDE